MEDGRHLAALTANYRQYRDEYLQWSGQYPSARDEALPHYRRALIAWYEARIDPADPYLGEVYPFLTAVAEDYFTGQPPAEDRVSFAGEDPLNHLPHPIHLQEAGQLLLQRFHEQEVACQELLLLADYHRLEPDAILRALDLEDQPAQLAARLRQCRRDVEGPDPESPLLWTPVLTVAGRQDLVQTLTREEARSPEAPPAAPARPEEAKPEAISLSRRRSNFSLPAVPTIIAGLLFGFLLWLLYDTFGGKSPDRLYTTYFEPYPNIFAAAPPETEPDRDLQRILYYYDRGDYRTAYDELLPTAPAYPASPLYLGVSALALNDPQRARDWLNQIPPVSKFYPPARWYEALALLGSGGTAGATTILKEIANSPNHPYRREASNLLSDL